ncbi:MAG TPA: hypothetical protein VD968_13115 [Pyrinomonadaceae bacterium]|nr:hypothetical protein [Pyrinomonadaceae bacterium]
MFRGSTNSKGGWALAGTAASGRKHASYQVSVARPVNNCQGQTAGVPGAVMGSISLGAAIRPDSTQLKQ